RSFCENEIAGVRVVAELQYSPNEEEAIQRVGDSFAELLFICVDSGVGTCWDFGHAYMNERRYGLSAMPPDQLWRYIAHVHCHDVYLGDHFPLVYDRVPWRDYLGGLLEREFDGTVIIEVPPELYVMSGGLESLEKSVAGVRAFVDDYQRHES
ncbi:MAG: TIM barrel protein, partial [bacterium]